LNRGAGLATLDGNEVGWDVAWASRLATLRVDWDKRLTVDPVKPDNATWTSTAGANERRPVNYVTWYEMVAFCIWSGGFLPSEAEWEYAAAGGSAGRTYPWGSASPTSSLAVFNTEATANVGTVPAGNGLWGHSDLAGNVSEWALDYSGSYRVPCVDCVNFPQEPSRATRGSSVFHKRPSELNVINRNSQTPSSRDALIGGRCARAPVAVGATAGP